MPDQPFPLSEILTAFARRGHERYGIEPVSQLQHALQSAALADQAHAPASLVSAALLHDIGHIFSGEFLPQDCDANLHDHHEERAYGWLKQHFGIAVADPVRLHVAAKRYLCSTDPSDVSQLSPTSLKSFSDQGGLMSAAELLEFEGELYFRQALELRRWDDLAKDSQAVTADIEHFVPYLLASMVARAEH